MFSVKNKSCFSRQMYELFFDKKPQIVASLQHVAVTDVITVTHCEIDRFKIETSVLTSITLVNISVWRPLMRDVLSLFWAVAQRAYHTHTKSSYVVCVSMHGVYHLHKPWFFCTALCLNQIFFFFFLGNSSFNVFSFQLESHKVSAFELWVIWVYIWL